MASATRVEHDSTTGLTRRRANVLAALGLLALFLVELDGARTLSVTVDEPSEIGAGFGNLVHREFVLGCDHPPLTKLLGAGSALLLGVRENGAAATYDRMRTVAREVPRASTHGIYGTRIIFHENPGFRLPLTRPGAPSVILAARLPLLAFPVLLALVAFLWARDRFGEAAGLVALALVGTDPDVLGHGSIVGTDMPLAALSLLAGYALDRSIARGGRRWLLALGVSLGLALVTKFSALFLAAALGAVALVAALRPDAGQPASVANPFGAGSRGVRLRAFALAGAAVLLVAGAVAASAYFFDRPFTRYRAGIEIIRLMHGSGRRAWLAGHATGEHLWRYFPVARAIRTPLGTFLTLGLAVAAAIRRRLPVSAEAALALPPLVVGASLAALANPLGTRYVLPAVVFLLTSSGRAATWAGASRARWAILLAALASNGWVAARAHPFGSLDVNPLAGPRRLAYRLLDDSNVDWAGGVGALAAWQRAHGSPPLVVVPFSPAPFLVGSSRAAGPRRVGALTVAEFADLPAWGVEGEIVAPATVFRPLRGRVHAVSAHVVASALALEAEHAGETLEWPWGAGPARVVLGEGILPEDDVGGFLIFSVP